MTECSEELLWEIEEKPKTARGLLVDADPKARELGMAALREAGNSVTGAGNSTDALQKMLLCREPLDFVVVDGDAPACKAGEVVAAARTLFPDARILMTARTGMAGMGPGDDVLPKPFTGEQLAVRVMALLGVAPAPKRPEETDPVNALLVGGSREDYQALKRICAVEGWRMRRVATTGEAIKRANEGSTSMILTEPEAPDGTWRVLVDRFAGRKGAPRVIVCSRLADDRLWAEVLNLGAFDLLNMPFQEKEVRHVIGHAWRSWQSDWGLPVKRARKSVTEIARSSVA